MSGCSTSTTLKERESSSRNTDIALQHISRQCAFFMFMNSTDQMKNKSPEELVDLVQKFKSPPYPIYVKVQNLQKETVKISLNISSIANNWIIDCFNKPKLFAQAIVQYFNKKQENLDYFGLVVFPSLYRNFIFEEFQKEALKLILEILELEKSLVSLVLVFSFAFLNGNFFQALWKEYDTNVGNELPPLSHSDHLRLLIDAFTKAFNVLTIYQQDALLKGIEKNEEEFASIFFSEIFSQSYYIYHKNIIMKEETDPVLMILKFIGKNPASPHFTMFHNAMKKRTGYATLIKQSDTFSGPSTTLLLSFRDLYILQEVMISLPGLTAKYDKSLLIPDAFEWSIDSLTIDLVLEFFIQATPQSDDFAFEIPNLDIQESPELKKDWKKINILAKKKRLMLFDNKVQSRKMTKIRNKIKGIGDPSLKKYVISSTIDSIVREVRTFQNTITKITSLKILEKLIEDWSENLRRAILFVAPIFIKQNGTEPPDYPTLSTASMSAIQTQPMLSNAFLKFKDPSQMKLRTLKSTQMIEQQRTRRLTNPGKPLIRQIAKKDAAKMKRKMRLSVDQSFSREQVAEICDKCQNQDLKLSLYLDKIDMWKPKNFNIIELREKYSEYVNVLRMHLKANPITNKDIIPFLRQCSRQFDSLVIMRRGLLVVKLSHIAADLHSIFEAFEPQGFTDMDIMKITATISMNDGLFAAFIYVEKMLVDFPDLRSMMSESMIEGINFIEKIMWSFIGLLNVDFSYKCKALFENSRTGPPSPLVVNPPPLPSSPSPLMSPLHSRTGSIPTGPMSEPVSVPLP